jgi:hypothetical protein
MGDWLEFVERDYPAVFAAADLASKRAQRRYLNFTRCSLVLLVLGAGLAALSPIFVCAKSGLALASSISVAASLLSTLYRRSQKPEHLWYGGRAVAESVKTMAWRYMVAAAPFEAVIPAAEVDHNFISALESIVKEKAQLAFGLGGEFSEQPQISERMRTVRSAGLNERTRVYLSGRISDQRSWYGAQAKKNKGAERRYFFLVFASQLAALAATIFLVRWPGSNVRLTGFFASLAGALMAWFQLKEHKGLAQSYSVAELELGFIEEKSRHIKTEQEFSDFVSDAENAISREHTLWVARRDRI